MNFNSQITIRNKTIGPGNRPYIIAEMACAHDGSFEKAKQIIDASVAAGADATQLQFFVPECTVTPHHEAFGILQDIVFTAEEWTELFNYSRSKDIDVWVCTYDVPSVELAVKLGADGIKLNSADLMNPDVVVAVAKSGIPFTLGTGASTVDEVRSGLQLAEDNGAKDVVLMQGVQNFPTKNEDLHISRMVMLRNEFEGLPVGYADHTDGDDPFGKIIDLVAVGLGANLIEKHITIDRSEKGIDYQAALEPEEYKLFVANIHKAFVAFGTHEVRPFTPSDLKYRKFQKKGVVAGRDIASGETITRADVEFIRNVEPGVAPINFPELEGKKAARDIKKFENIVHDDVA
jgi:sialic acid synthase SpsE